MPLTDLPEHLFWDFSLQLYADKAVAEACLALQDSCGLNVNLLLYCCWTGTQGYLLTARDVQHQMQAVQHWQENVLKPLRAIRRRMKAGVQGFPGQRSERLRQAIQQIEIDAEHLEQLQLAEFITRSKSTRTGAETAADNLATYLSVCGIERNQEIDAWLAVLIDACGQQTC